MFLNKRDCYYSIIETEKYKIKHAGTEEGGKRTLTAGNEDVTLERRWKLNTKIINENESEQVSNGVVTRVLLSLIGEHTRRVDGLLPHRRASVKNTFVLYFKTRTLYRIRYLKKKKTHTVVRDFLSVIFDSTDVRISVIVEQYNNVYTTAGCMCTLQKTPANRRA